MLSSTYHNSWLMEQVHKCYHTSMVLTYWYKSTINVINIRNRPTIGNALSIKKRVLTKTAVFCIGDMYWYATSSVYPPCLHWFYHEHIYYYFIVLYGQWYNGHRYCNSIVSYNRTRYCNSIVLFVDGFYSQVVLTAQSQCSKYSLCAVEY